MPGPSCTTNSPVKFAMDRQSSGTSISAIVDIWENPFTPTQKLIKSVTLPGPGGKDSESIALNSGKYVAVVRIFIHKSLNDFFNYELSCNNQIEFMESGRLIKESNPDAAGRNGQFDLMVH